ncbi:hypothetical protein Efla_007138 [Eimeria flavescens]
MTISRPPLCLLSLLAAAGPAASGVYAEVELNEAMPLEVILTEQEADGEQNEVALAAATNTNSSVNLADLLQDIWPIDRSLHAEDEKVEEEEGEEELGRGGEEGKTAGEGVETDREEEGAGGRGGGGGRSKEGTEERGDVLPRDIYQRAASKDAKKPSKASKDGRAVAGLVLILLGIVWAGIHIQAYEALPPAAVASLRRRGFLVGRRASHDEVEAASALDNTAVGFVVTIAGLLVFASSFI